VHTFFHFDSFFVEVFDSPSFEDATIEAMTFESDSNLSLTEEICFCRCKIKRFCALVAIEFLGQSCFGEGSVGGFAFEGGPKWTQIAPLCFAEFHITAISTPSGVEVLPNSCFSGRFGARTRSGRYHSGQSPDGGWFICRPRN
jgi:hypothetical protein